MPSIGQRGEQMPPSPIRKLVPYAEEARKKGIRVHYLNIGQPDIETPPAILDAVRQSDFKILAYSPSEGNESYRRKLAEYYRRAGIPVDHQEIIITTGGSEAIIFGMMACLDPGEEIIIPEPFYANYAGFAREAGIRLRPVVSEIENGFSLPHSTAFETLISPRTRAILICNPNNPTGYLYKKEELELLKELCLQHNLFLFSDEAYREFCYSGRHISALELPGMEDHVILMDTISKRYSACGGRIGALVTHNRQVLDAVRKFAQARLSPPSFAQILAEAAVDLPADYFEGVKAEYRARRDLLVGRLNSMKNVFCPVPEGAFYCMARLPVPDTDLFCQWLLEEFTYRNQTLMLAPASGFYATPGRGRDEVRLAYVINRQDIHSAMDCLEIALDQYRFS